MNEPLRVLVVDDHPIVRRGLITEINLNTGMRVVGEAVDGREAVQEYIACQPDVVLMDLVMPGMDGIQATREILKHDPQARILILTSFTEEKNILEVLKAGAMGFIFKDKHPNEVLAAIRDISADIPVLAPGITRKLLREAQSRATRQPVQLLTDRELVIIRQVATGKPYKEIARDIHIQEATVRAHVSNILGKLSMTNRSQLVLYAVEHQILDLPDGNPSTTP